MNEAYNTISSLRDRIEIHCSLNREKSFYFIMTLNTSTQSFLYVLY